jgi:hypothetical protein
VESMPGGEGWRYRSRAGMAAFGAWCVAISAMAIFAVWGAARGDDPAWIIVAWIVGMVGLAIHSLSLELIVTADGEMEFRGLYRRRRWHVTQLRAMRSGSGCMVFEFTKGRALLAGGSGSDRLAMLALLRELDPTLPP